MKDKPVFAFFVTTLIKPDFRRNVLRLSGGYPIDRPARIVSLGVYMFQNRLTIFDTVRYRAKFPGDACLLFLKSRNALMRPGKDRTSRALQVFSRKAGNPDPPPTVDEGRCRQSAEMRPLDISTRRCRRFVLLPVLFLAVPLNAWTTTPGVTTRDRPRRRYLDATRLHCLAKPRRIQGGESADHFNTLHRSRRHLLQTFATTGRSAVLVVAGVIQPVTPSSLASATPTSKDSAQAATDAIASIKEATEALQSLLDNWAKAVIDCTYADVPRELLETKNKEELLEKASTFALFDKSVSVVSCKTSNRIVRDYLGRTGKGPVVGLDKRLRQALDALSDDVDLDAYLQSIEEVQQALSKADSLSYAAGVSDLAALNNFDKVDEAAVLANMGSSLQECRQAIQTAVDGLRRITDMFM